ncbi:MAG TPA: hypothetical protein VGW38_29925 [Chloroflexota bacterium]|nr:hypothetical protein [Chloroflexota bacterium]
MPFVEIKTIGMASNIQVQNAWWYRTEANIVFSNADLGAFLDSHRLLMEAPTEAFWPPTMGVLQHIAQGYDDSWNRAPYLPLIREVTGWVGARSTSATAMPPHVAAVLSARVEPVLPGPQKDKLGVVSDKPVRRGYWSLSPIIQGDAPHDGRIPNTQLQSAVFGNLRAACAANLTGTTASGALTPVKVSKPVEGIQRRGYGRVVDTVWRPYVSTRRSRMYGKGA